MNDETEGFSITPLQTASRETLGFFVQLVIK